MLNCETESAEETLLELFTQQQTPTGLQKYLEHSFAEIKTTPDGNYMVTPFGALGNDFAGEIVLKNGVPDRIAIWTREPSISPTAGLELFEGLAGILERELGESKRIHDIPNYGDGSNPKSSAFLWFIDSEMIMLQLVRYSSRSRVSIVRKSSESWRGRMGADESIFWHQTLDWKPELPPIPPPSSDTRDDSLSGLVQETPSLTSAPKNTQSAKPAASSPSDELHQFPGASSLF